jgi:sugar lactone lactonase YvrE
MRRIATALCTVGLLGLLGPASASAFGPVGSFGGAGSGNGQFNHPQGIAATGGTVYVADTANNRVEYFGATSPWAFQGVLSGSPASPEDVAIAPDGEVAAGPGQVVHWILGLLPVSWSPPGTSYGVAVFGGSAYVSDSQNGVIRKYDPLTGSLQGTIGSGQLAQPQGMTSDGSGVYVADTGNGRIVKFDAAGNVLGIWTMPTYTIVAGGVTTTGRIEPHDVAVDGSGRVFAPDAGTHSNLVAVFTADGTLQQILGSPDSDPGNPCAMRSPWGLAVNGSVLYVASTGENSVRVFDDGASPCPAVNFGAGGGITPPPTGVGSSPAGDRLRPKIRLTGFPKGCARQNFAFTIHASDDVLLKRLTLLVNHRRVANQQINKQDWSVKVKIPVRNVRRQLPHGASVRVLIEVRVTDATGKKARKRRAFRICG